MESAPIMLFAPIFVLITLASGTTNNVSSKPSDNKVSSSLYGLQGGEKKEKKEKNNEILYRHYYRP